MVKSLAIEIAPHNVRANVVCPFSVGTDMIINQPTYDLMTGGPGGTHEASAAAFQAMNLFPDPVDGDVGRDPSLRLPRLATRAAT